MHHASHRGKDIISWKPKKRNKTWKQLENGDQGSVEDILEFEDELHGDSSFDGHSRHKGLRGTLSFDDKVRDWRRNLDSQQEPPQRPEWMDNHLTVASQAEGVPVDVLLRADSEASSDNDDDDDDEDDKGEEEQEGILVPRSSPKARPSQYATL